MRVDGEDFVRVTGTGEVVSGSERDPDSRASAEELTDRRRRLARLVGRELAELLARGVEHPQDAAGGVGGAEGHPGGGVAVVHDVGLTSVVEVGDGRGGEITVALEEGEAAEDSASGVEGVKRLTKGARSGEGADARGIADGDPGGHRAIGLGVARLVVDRLAEDLLPRRVDLVVPASVGLGGVADPKEDRAGGARQD